MTFSIRKFSAAVLALIMTLSLAALPAASQVVVNPGQTGAARSNTSGLFLNLHLNGTAASYENDGEESDTENGGGFGGAIGYGFGPLFGAFLRVDAASISGEEDEEYTAAHVDLGARASFGGKTQALIPYVEGAITGRALVLDFLGEDVTYSGPAFSLGGGLQYFFSSALALDAALVFSFGEYTDVSYDDESVSLEDEAFSSTTTRLNIGVSWYPLNR